MRERLLCLLLCLFSSGAFANSAQPLVVAFNTLPPWETLTPDGHPSGPYLDIMQDLAHRLGVPLDVRPCPLLRCIEWLKRGNADLSIGIAPGPGRDDILDFLSPAFAAGSAVGFYRITGSPVAVTSYKDLRHLRIGTIDGAHYFPRFDQDASLFKDAAPNWQSNLRKLLAHRVDVVVMPRGVADQMLKIPAFHGKVSLAGPVVFTGPRNVVLARASRHYADKARIERALRQMVAEGDIRRILRPVE